MHRAGLAARLVRPRHAALDGEVELERARPVLGSGGTRVRRARAAGRRRCRRRPAGARSSTTASAGGSSASDVTRTPGLDRAAVLGAGTAASASVIEREPPRATGQPPAWQATISAIPTAELSGRVSGLNACAATPPNSARACGVLTEAREHGRRQPRPAARSAPAAAGASARGAIGRNRSSLSASNAARRAAEDAPPGGRRRAPRPAAVASIDCSITPALPSSSGWARSTSGQHHRGRGARARASCRNGDDGRHRVNRRAVVVQHPGNRELAGPRAAADRVGGLEHGHLEARPRERPPRRRARWARSRRRSRRSRG